MKSALPKVLHKVAGLPLLGHVIGGAAGAGVDRIVVVTSAAGEAVRDYAKPLGCESAIQEQQLGTGHAAASARDALADFDGTLVIVNGDMPLITGDTISECLKAQAPHRPGAAGLRGRRSRRLWPGAADAGRLSGPHRRIQGCEREPSAPSPCAMPAAMPPTRRNSSAGRRR